MIGAKEQMINSRPLQFVPDKIAVKPAAAAVSNERFAGFGFFSAKNSAAKPACLGRILKLQNDAIMAVSERLQCGQSFRIVQVT